MPTAKPQDTAQAVGKTSLLAEQPAPATGVRGRLKAAEPPARGRARMSRMLPKSVTSPAASGDGGNCPVHRDGRGGGNAPFYVPVLSSAGKPLMPCHPARARELVRKGRAVRRFRKGFFYIQLVDRRDGQTQPVACGIDPGSRWEALTVKDAQRTFLQPARRRRDPRAGRGPGPAGDAAGQTVQENSLQKALHQQKHWRDPAFDEGPVGVEAQARGLPRISVPDQRLRSGGREGQDAAGPVSLEPELLPITGG